jgi:amino acid adenylation domain-containing protein
LDLTCAQRQIWIGQQLAADSPLYNMALAFTIEGALEPELFERALRRLLEGCDSLRTIFVETDAGPQRRSLLSPTLPFEYRDLSDQPDAEVLLRADLEERTRRHFRQGELMFDTALFRLGAERFVWYLNQHHLITDAWSTAMLFRRLSALYQAEQRGASESCSESSSDWPSYGEFVRYERKVRDSRQGERAREYWRARAAEARRPALFYGAAPSAHSARSRRHAVPLGMKRSVALRALAESTAFRAITSDMALFHVFATVLLALMHRVADTAEPRFAAPSHNRSSARLRETMGLLIELFPLSVRIDEDESFVSLAAKTARANQNRIVHAAPGTSEFAPSSDVVLNYIKGGFGRFAELPTEADWIHSGEVDLNHKLRLQIYDFDQTGEFRIEFDLAEAVFGPYESEAAIRHFLVMLDALLANPAQSICAPALTSADELAALRAEPATTPPPPSLLEQIEAQAVKTPNATAIRDGELEISYREMRRRVQEVAATLRAGADGPEERIGVFLPRSADLVIALQGVLAAGAAYVPLDPGIPDDRLAFIARDADLKRVLTTPELTPRAAAWAPETVTLGEAVDSPEPVPSEPPLVPDADALAYVLYTSGSTGRPKGVMITRHSLANYIHWARQQYSDGEALCFPLFTSPGFDLTVTSIFTPLVCGGSVVVYRSAAEGDAFVVRRVIEDDQVDVVKLTPSHLALIRDLPLDRSRIRTLILGGEDLSTDLAAATVDAFGGDVTLYNEYGPTEATVACTLHRFDRARDRGVSVPIGQPADNARVTILDSHLRPLPRGVIGEIAIAGSGVARGYLGLEERTRESFVPDPLYPGATLYLTGDRGRRNRAGQLEFLGRADSQVKWRGARIELGEVEAVLAGFLAVRSAAAKLVAALPSRETARYCVRCGLEDAHPEARIDSQGVCAICHRFEQQRVHVARYFGSMEDLKQILAQAREQADGRDRRQDCVVLTSGGKDSTYALCRVVDLGARPLVFHLDNGYISQQALDNVRRVVDKLGLELVVGRTPAMNRIFTDSLRRYSNVCNGCFKTIYTLAMNLARERGIDTIVTGLSRGQIFETRLADLYRRDIFDPEVIDRTVLEARKAYHLMDDEVARSLDVEIFENDSVFQEIRFVDFYRYCDATLDEVMGYLQEHTPWLRPSDTGRSTNCRLNEVGIFVHKTERGFHNYSLPYSWDVRLGHKQRDAALAELDDRIDMRAVREHLDELEYRESSAVGAGESRLVAYYVSDRELSTSELRRFMAETLPPESVPALFVRLEALPLTANGKLDRAALPALEGRRPTLEHAFAPPRSVAERVLAEAWCETLDLDRVGIDDNYFELGGDSIQCIQIVSIARRRGWLVTPQLLFDHPTLAELARRAVSAAEGSTSALTAAQASEAEFAEILEEFGEAN